MLIKWVAISELILDLHFVTDVAAGLFGGLALALFATRFWTATPTLSHVNSDLMSSRPE